jgi:hypothetical protein
MKIPIRRIRDVAVILDSDLAAIYGVPTRRLNEQVRRNKLRFPADFAFVLTANEWRLLRSDLSQDACFQAYKGNRSQIATGSYSAKHRDKRARPYAFTEHGARMGANVLRSPVFKSRSGVPPLNPNEKRRGRRLYISKRELGFHVRERTATYRVKRRRP